MLPRSSLSRTAFLASALLALCAGRVLGQSDPFGPALRWTYQASLSSPWIPGSAAFAAGGEIVWASGNFANPRLMVLSSPREVLGEVLYQDLTVSDSISVLHATSRVGSTGVFSVAQFADPDEFNRRTEVSRYDPIGGPFDMAPSWTHDADLVVNGPARIACDALGRTVVVGVWNSSTGDVQLDWLNGLNGNLVQRLQVPASGLNVIAISDDGSRVVLGAGRDVWIFDSATGTDLYHEVLLASTQAITISGDGRRVAYGERQQVAGGVFQSRIRVLEENGGGYGTWIDVLGLADELPTRAKLSFDGGTLAIGWWNLVTGLTVRYEVFDTNTDTTLNNYMQAASVGMLQGFPESIDMTSDGSRVAFGGWGNGGQDPEVLLVERGVADPIMEITLPGSVRALDLDPSGTRMIIGSKNAHANQFSNTGELRLYDTGERDLVMLDQPELGGSFSLAAQRSGATSTVFLVGVRATQANAFGNITGLLALNRRLPVYVEVRPADASGRADAQFDVPVDARWSGETLAVQALFRFGGGQQAFSDTVIEPLVL